MISVLADHKRIDDFQERWGPARLVRESDLEGLMALGSVAEQVLLACSELERCPCCRGRFGRHWNAACPLLTLQKRLWELHRLEAETAK